MTKSEVVNDLSNFLGKIDIDLLLKYSMELKLTSRELEKLEEIYLENISKQKRILKNKIKFESIEILISYVSYSCINENEIYLESILDKNLRIFPNLKSFILIYSKETEKLFEQIVKKYPNINVNGVQIDEITNFNLQLKIGKYIDKLKPRRDNSIIDITLGMKAITIYLYKLAIEREIFSINWKEKQIPIYIYDDEKKEYIKGKGVKRFPFSAKLELMIEPQKENIKIYEYINNSLKKFDFLATESYYNQLGNKGMEYFYRELSKLFSFQNMISLDVENFYSQVELFFISLSESKDLSRENILRLRPFLKNLLSLILFEVEDEIIETRKFYWLSNFLTKFQMKSEDIYETIFLAEYKEEIYYLLILEYFNSKMEEDNGYYYQKFMRDLRKSIVKELGIEDGIAGKIFINDGNSAELLDIDISDILKRLNPSISLLEIIRGDFYFENKVLYVEKYNLRIDTEKDKRIAFINNKGADILRELMRSYTVSLGGKELFERLTRYNEDENEIVLSNRFRKNLTVLKNKAKDFNNYLKEIGKEEGVELDDLILYRKLDGEESNYLHQFQINPKFYTLV